jgi:hypothetical protein
MKKAQIAEFIDRMTVFMTMFCREAIFFRGLDSGAAFSYSPISGRNPWSVASPLF